MTQEYNFNQKKKKNELSRSGHFMKLIVNHLTNVNVSKILSLNMSNMKKLKKHNFNQSLQNSGGENMVNFYFNIYLTLKKYNLVGIWNVN